MSQILKNSQIHQTSHTHTHTNNHTVFFKNLLTHLYNNFLHFSPTHSLSLDMIILFLRKSFFPKIENKQPSLSFTMIKICVLTIDSLENFL